MTPDPVECCTLIHLDDGGYDEFGCYWGVDEPLYHVELRDGSEEWLRESDLNAKWPTALALVCIPDDSWLYDAQ